jgi:serine/threonine-protein kinase Chk2
MMTVDPLKRITIKKVLGHPWFNDKEMLNKVNNLLSLKGNENVLPRRLMNDNIPTNPTKYKRARLE